MPLDTVARRDDAVLIVVDEQERLTAVMDRREQVNAATVRLMRTATLLGVPIIVTRQYPQGLGDISPDLAVALDAAQRAGATVIRVDKVAFDCFGDPLFVTALARTGRRQLIVAGMETHICIAQTALTAVREGFDVHVVADSCCSRDAGSHDLALERLRAAGVVVTVVESAMYELVGAADTDEFRALLQIVKE